MSASRTVYFRYVYAEVCVKHLIVNLNVFGISRGYCVVF